MILKIGFFFLVVGVALWMYFNNAAQRYEQQIDREVAAFQQMVNTIPTRIYSDHDLINLPEPVQRYAEFSCILGREAIKFAHLKHTGFFRTAPNKDFLPINGEEFFITVKPGFIWKANLKMNGLPIAVRDRYWKEEGNMLVQAFWTFPLANATGEEINISSLLRYLMEAVWIPSALLGDNIQWTAVDKNSAKATITDGDLSASVTFYFNEEGAIIKAITKERYMTEGDKQVNYPWIGIMRDYREINGFKIPTRANVAWNINGNEFVYAKLLVNDIDFSPKQNSAP